jgi:hypothetical protein
MFRFKADPKFASFHYHTHMARSIFLVGGVTAVAILMLTLSRQAIGAAILHPVSEIRLS